MRRKITLAFLILAAFLLQTTVFQYFQIASVTPNLLLILTSAFGLMRGKKEGLMVGFFSGLMIDLFYGMCCSSCCACACTFLTIWCILFCRRWCTQS